MSQWEMPRCCALPLVMGSTPKHASRPHRHLETSCAPVHSPSAQLLHYPVAWHGPLRCPSTCSIFPAWTGHILSTPGPSSTAPRSAKWPRTLPALCQCAGSQRLPAPVPPSTALGPLTPPSLAAWTPPLPTPTMLPEPSTTSTLLWLCGTRSSGCTSTLPAGHANFPQRCALGLRRVGPHAPVRVGGQSGGEVGKVVGLERWTAQHVTKTDL